MAQRKAAVVVLLHGSRRASAAAEARDLAARLQPRLGGRPCAVAFLQDVAPTLTAAVAALAAAGVARVDVLPLFVVTGRHVEEDLPALLAAVQAAHPGLELRLHPHLARHDAFLSALVTILG